MCITCPLSSVDPGAAGQGELSDEGETAAGAGG